MERLLRYNYTSTYGIAVVKTESGKITYIIMRKNAIKIKNKDPTDTRLLAACRGLVHYSRWRHYLQFFKRKPTANAELCAICRFDIKTVAVTMSCGHVFHRNCILKWFQQKNECPLCRKELFNETVAFTCFCFLNSCNECKMSEK